MGFSLLAGSAIIAWSARPPLGTATIHDFNFWNFTYEFIKYSVVSWCRDIDTIPSKYTLFMVNGEQPNNLRVNSALL